MRWVIPNFHMEIYENVLLQSLPILQNQMCQHHKIRVMLPPFIFSVSLTTQFKNHFAYTSQFSLCFAPKSNLTIVWQQHHLLAGKRTGIIQNSICFLALQKDCEQFGLSFSATVHYCNHLKIFLVELNPLVKSFSHAYFSLLKSFVAFKI